jgi:beta-lactamase class D
MYRLLQFRWIISLCIILGCIWMLHPPQPALTMPQVDLKPIDLAQAPIAQPPAPQTINFERHFQDLGIEGSILIYDAQRDRAYQHNPRRNAQAFLPASTFKIFNAMVALETGAIANELSILTWDGIQREIPAWNRDLNLKEAFKLSAVWFYQVLARRAGYEQMQKWIKQAEYGNQTIGSPADIDKFWLEGDLRITPQQQVNFLQRLYRNDLPFSARSLSLVKELMILEQTPAYTLRGKTGWIGVGTTQRIEPEIGWLVGYLEKGDAVYFFATNIDIRNDKDPAARMEVTRRCLKELVPLG